MNLLFPPSPLSPRPPKTHTVHSHTYSMLSTDLFFFLLQPSPVPLVFALSCARVCARSLSHTHIPCFVVIHSSTYARTTHTHTHKCTTLSHTRTHTRTHAPQAHTHTITHAHTHIQHVRNVSDSISLAHMHARTHARTHAPQAHTHTFTHAHTHTYTLTHTPTHSICPQQV